MVVDGLDSSLSFFMTEFTSNIIKIINDIPKGKVMTYGQVAKLAGNPKGARQVVRILHSMSEKYCLPWHRVINRNGEIVIKSIEGSNIQKDLLNQEGIEFMDGKIDLKQYRV